MSTQMLYMLQRERGARLLLWYGTLFALGMGLALFLIGMALGGERPSSVDRHGNQVVEQKKEKPPIQPIGLGIIAGGAIGVFLLKKSRAKGVMTIDDQGFLVRFQDKKQKAGWDEVSHVSWGSQTDDPKYRAKMGPGKNALGGIAADALIKMASDIWVLTISTTQGQQIVLHGVDFVDATSTKAALLEAITSRGIEGPA